MEFGFDTGSIGNTKSALFIYALLRKKKKLCPGLISKFGCFDLHFFCKIIGELFKDKTRVSFMSNFFFNHVFPFVLYKMQTLKNFLKLRDKRLCV